MNEARIERSSGELVVDPDNRLLAVLMAVPCSEAAYLVAERLAGDELRLNPLLSGRWHTIVFCTPEFADFWLQIDNGRATGSAFFIYDQKLEPFNV